MIGRDIDRSFGQEVRPAFRIVGFRRLPTATDAGERAWAIDLIAGSDEEISDKLG